MGVLLYPDSDLAEGIAAFSMIATLIVGYKIWGAYVAGTMVRRLFGGFFAAAVRFVFSRDAKDAHTAMTHLRQALGDREQIESMLRTLRERAAVFGRLGFLFGAMGGLAIGAFADTGPGFLGSVLVLTLTGSAYGAVLTRLAKAGLLLLPFQDN